MVFKSSKHIRFVWKFIHNLPNLKNEGIFLIAGKLLNSQVFQKFNNTILK